MDLNFKNIAVVGASDNPLKVGSVILKNIIDGNFKGEVFAVNPKYDNINEVKCYKSLSEINTNIDLVVFAIPAANVVEVITKLDANKVKNALIISSGFHENSDHTLEDNLIKIAKEKNIRLFGPNSLGLIDVKNNLNASFGKSMPGFEKVSILSQSGALVTILMDLAKEFNMGFSKMFSIGDKIDLSENEIIQFLSTDPDTEIIAGYFETLKNEKEFIEIIKVSNKKFVFLKPLTSKEAKEFSKNHTGETEDSNLEEIYKQAGAIIVESMEDMFFTLMGLSWIPKLKSKNIGIITNAGGPAEVITDRLSELGFNFPDSAEFRNPLDLEGDALSDEYSTSILKLSEFNEIDLIICLVTPQAITDTQRIAEAIINYKLRIINSENKHILGLFLGGTDSEDAIKKLTQNKIPAFQFMEHAVEVIKNLA